MLVWNIVFIVFMWFFSRIKKINVRLNFQDMANLKIKKAVNFI